MPQTLQARSAPTLRQGKPNREQSTAPTEAENRRSGRQNNQQSPKGTGSHKTPPHCHTKSSHNHSRSSLTQGAEPSEPRQSSRCRRSTENTREGRQPNLRHQRSSRLGRRGQKRQKPPRVTCGRGSRAKPQAPEEEHGTRLKTKRRTKDTANPTDIAPPQEQDRQLRPERLRNPLRVTCGRARRRKPQAPQEEAKKQTPVRGSTNAYPAQSRRRKRRHSSAASERINTHTHTQGQPGRRSSAKNVRAATAGDGPSVGQAD